MVNGSAASRLGGRLLRTRVLVRAPIIAFRLRLGFLFGSRLVLLEHRGRRSGARRRVVLEVIGRTDRGVVVASGFGARAQWFRNLRADPYARVTLGSRGPQPVRARVLSAAEATAVLRRYAEHHPRAWARLRPILEETLGATITDAGTGLPLVALEFEPSRAG